MALTQRSRTVLTLYSSRDDVQCHRARLVLAAKGVVYDLVPVNPDSPPEDLLDLNPYNSVPTLVDRDLVLYDTSVICEYLDERYPHPPLMPVDPLSRARLRLAIVRIERDWLPYVGQIDAGGDVDPASEMNVWLSTGSTHLWHLHEAQPATAWEAEMDRLMQQQLTIAQFRDRKQLYDRVQLLIAENLPIICLATPNILVGAKANLSNFRPANLDHYTLWNVDELFWRQ